MLQTFFAFFSAQIFYRNTRKPVKKLVFISLPGKQEQNWLII